MMSDAADNAAQPPLGRAFFRCRLTDSGPAIIADYRPVIEACGGRWSFNENPDAPEPADQCVIDLVASHAALQQILDDPRHGEKSLVWRP